MDTQERADALQEIVNIGMGYAASSLALTLDTFVCLPVPAVRFVRSAALLDAIAQLTFGATKITAVRQGFTSSFRGEALVLFGDQSAGEVGALLGYSDNPAKAEIEEILLEISNILVGACLGGIAEQLSYHLDFSAPSFIAHDRTLDALLEPRQMTWERALVVEVNFRLERRAFVCHILLLWPEESFEALGKAIDRLLEVS